MAARGIAVTIAYWLIVASNLLQIQLFYSDSLGNRARHFRADLVHVAGAATASSRVKTRTENGVVIQVRAPDAGVPRADGAA